MDKRRMRRRTRALTSLVAALALAAACSDGRNKDRAQPPITAPPTSATTSTTTAEPERIEAQPPPDEPRPDIDVNVTYPADFTDEQVAVVDAYRGYVHAYYVARDPCGPTVPGMPAKCSTDPNHELLDDFAAGVRLSALRTNLETRLDTVAIPGPTGRYRQFVTDLSLESDLSTLTACTVDDAVVLDAETGAVIDDDVVTRRIRVVLERHEGKWFVTGQSIAVLDEWAGDEGERCLEDFS